MMKTSRRISMFASATFLTIGGSLMAQETPKPAPPAAVVEAKPDASTSLGLKFVTSACARGMTPDVACNACHSNVVTQTGNGGSWLMDLRQAGVSVPWVLDQQGKVDWASPHHAGWSFIAANKAPADDLGATLAPADASLCSQLGLKSGLVVADVQDGGRAVRAGLKANDILLSLADRPLANPEDLLTTLKAVSQQHPADQFSVKLLRAGKPAEIAIRAEVRVALAPVTEEAKKPDYYIGTRVNPLDATFRAHLDIAEGTGLLVGEISADTPAAKAGVKSGDILLQFDGQPLPDADVLRAKVQAKGPHAVKLEILRAGKRTTVDVTPEPRKPEPVSTLQDRSIETWDLVTTNAHLNNQGRVDVLSQAPYINRLFVNGNIQAQNAAAGDHLQPILAIGNTPPADLTKKIEELTAQVQALTKAVEGMKAAQGEKK